MSEKAEQVAFPVASEAIAKPSGFTFVKASGISSKLTAIKPLWKPILFISKRRRRF